MPSVINTNIASLNTQRNLSSSQSALNVSIQRLSTGLRVNSAKDDAAGLAIAERMNSQVRGLNVAARNANDGVSLAQTAEGALGKVGEMVQRIRELAVQSSNATNNDDDRAALQSEVDQLKKEIDRVANTTNFNGTKLLNGDFSSKVFQVGADAGQSITVAQIADSRLEGMGAVKTASADGGTLAAVASGGTYAALAEGDLKINGVSIGAIAASAVDATVATQLGRVAATINEKSAESGVTATVDGDNIVLSSMSGDIAVEVANSATASTGLSAATAATLDDATADGDMSDLDIGTYEGAQMAIRRADAAINQINTERATLGALQSRFENAVSNIQIASENATAARSRIMDTDFAAETANMTRAQILQQAGNAMLSQANQLPQQVLSLLR